jgi:hypothetical protein
MPEIDKSDAPVARGAIAFDALYAIGAEAHTQRAELAALAPALQCDDTVNIQARRSL